MSTHAYIFIKALGSDESEVNGQSSEQTSTAALRVKPHPPEGVDQALLKTPPKRTTGIYMYIHRLTVSTGKVIIYFVYMYPARKHTGKVGPRAVKKSPARKSNSHSSPSPKTTKESSSPLTDDGDANVTQSSTGTSPSKAENESPQNEKESEVEATPTQGGETAMDTSMEADSTTRDDGDQDPSPKIEETATPSKPSEEEKAKKDSKKTKQKIHPFFGMYNSVFVHDS